MATGRKAIWRDYSREYRQRNPTRNRAHKLKNRYGITEIEYNILLEAQNGRCAVCKGLPEPNRRLAVDHDHTTSRVRGLLCGNCNRGLGLFQDDAGLLEEARRYVTVGR